jgi:ribosome-binding protein aMBF1 (putative translation factor)
MHIGQGGVCGWVNQLCEGICRIKEIPKSQRYVSRPKLEVLLSEDAIIKKHKARERIKEAIEKYGYSQKEVADYLNVHYSTVSRVVNN